MIYVPHFRTYVVIPALADFPETMRQPNAVELLIGTALKESNLEFLKQSLRKTGDGRGRALGVFQMENATFKDHVAWLNRQPDLGAIVFPHGVRPATDMQGDLYFAARMARIHYWVRSPAAVPPLGNVKGYSAYWGKVWQTQSIPAQMAQFEALYREYALPTAPKVEAV